MIWWGKHYWGSKVLSEQKKKKKKEEGMGVLLAHFTHEKKRNLRNAGNGKKMEKTKLKRKLKITMKFTPQHWYGEFCFQN